MSGLFRKITVSLVAGETAHAKSFVFEVPPELDDEFAWRAGQHVTVRFMLGGREERRCFTISSSPHTGNPLRITVKRTKDGTVSRHLHETIKAGDKIDLLAPSGGFCLDPDEMARRTCYFFGAGSGITPLFSMISSLLVAEPYSAAHLLYGNADEDSIIFREALDNLLAQFGDRLTVSHVLSNQSFWSSFKPWRSGRVDAETIAAFIAENPPYAQDTQYYICGPGSMNQDVKSALMGMDVPQERIHMESFGGEASVADDGVTGTAAVARVKLAGQTHEVPIAQGQTILQALRDAGLDPPYSCQAGVCATCQAKLFSGRVHMRSRLALDDGEIEAGEILTCQSVPLTGKLEIRFPRR